MGVARSAWESGVASTPLISARSAWRGNISMQKIIVAIKGVVGYNVGSGVKADGSGVMLDGVKMSVNPFDEIALEEALRIKERGTNIEVVAVSIGVADTQQQLRTALAMGADRAILVQTDVPVEPLTAAQTFRAVAKKENPDLIFLGKQAIDDDANQTGQMLAAIWERPQATYASKVEISGGKASVTREVDAGLETIEVDLPAVVTVDLRLNEPRYVKLPDIMKAKKKPLDVTSLDALGVSAGVLLKTLTTEPPPPRRNLRTAAGGTRRRLHSCLRDFDELRQGSHAAHCGIARCTASQRLDGGRGSVSFQAADLRRECHCNGGSRSCPQAHRDRASGVLRSRKGRRECRCRIQDAQCCSPLAHALRRSQKRLDRSPRSANGQTRGLGRPGSRKRGELQAAVQFCRQNR